MQLSQIPAALRLAFAATGAKNTIPETSLIGVTDGAASLPDGFPPLTGTPIASGGVPPFRADMNGILYMLSSWIRWQSAGGGAMYDAGFAADTNVSGYPKGARILRSDGTGYWLNQTENNTTNPDTGGAGWVPDFNYGVTAITGLTNANVTLTAAQYAKGIITLAGTLTGNVQIIFPALAGEWIVVNNTTGAFTVTCKTAAGSGTSVARGVGSLIWGDSTNIYATLDGMGWAQIAALATAASLTPDATNPAQLKSSLDALYAPASGAVSYASSATTQTGTSTTQAVTPKGLADSMLGGNGQTWQVVTGSRAAGTTYYNTTGRPILVIYCSGDSNNGFIAKVNGGTIASLPGGGGAGSGTSAYFVVPPGANYSVSTSATGYTWAELR